MHYDWPATKEMAASMGTNDDYELYERFFEATELKAKTKVLNRALLILLTRVIAVLLLWFFFVRPYLDTRLFLLIILVFVCIQSITVFYLRFAERKTWFREGGPW